MLVLGLDPGLARSGWALLEAPGGTPRLRSAGCWTTLPEDSLSTRLLVLWDSFAELVAREQPQVVAVERLFFKRNVSTAMAVSHARGVLLCAGARAGLELHEYTPGQIKQAVTGNGAAGKEQVARVVRLLLGTELPPGPDDVSDACAVAICHQQARGMGRALSLAGAR